MKAPPSSVKGPETDPFVRIMTPADRAAAWLILDREFQAFSGGGVDRSRKIGNPLPLA
jgi:hypothetical protein